MRIRVSNTLDDLVTDMAAITKRAPREMRGVVRDALKVGNSLARDFAKQSAGAHGKHYHKAFTTEMGGVTSFGGVFGYSGEYGPDAARPQGGMSFERGSRNQPPHNDLARSAMLIGPAFAREVLDLADKWFWANE